MNTQQLILNLVAKNWTVQGLPSGKLRATDTRGTSYLLSPVDAVQFGTWFNEKTLLSEPIPT